MSSLTPSSCSPSSSALLTPPSSEIKVHPGDGQVEPLKWSPSRMRQVLNFAVSDFVQDDMIRAAQLAVDQGYEGTLSRHACLVPSSPLPGFLFMLFRSICHPCTTRVTAGEYLLKCLASPEMMLNLPCFSGMDLSGLLANLGWDPPCQRAYNFELSGSWSCVYGALQFSPYP